jgi:hypothetical protein
MNDKAEDRRLPPEIEGALKRRGLSVHRCCPTKDLIFAGLTDGEERLLYDRMRSYSVRLIMRDMIKHQDGFTEASLGDFSDEDERRRVIDLMAGLGIAERHDDSFRLARRPVRSFGPTLEWFVARMMEVEFASPAVWGITFRGVDSGGDFDVISYFENELIYIEVKSAPPKGIETAEAGAFLNRVNTLLPRAALFFVDTELRMRDRVVLLFHQEFLERMKDPYPRYPDLRNLEREIFHIDHRVFILNAYRDAATNFTVCLRDFLARGLSVL